MRSFSNSIKLNNVESYKVGNTNTNNVFKNQFYNNIDKMDYNVYEDIDYNQIEVDNADTTVEVLNIAAKTGATVLVGVTSVLSGVADLLEDAVDGGAWVVSAVGSAFGADMSGIKEFIARDLVSEANDDFYKNTELGKMINDNSLMKYDSEIAQGIRSVTKTVTTTVAATAISTVPGGAFIVAGAGFASGAGEAAESTYQRNGTDTAFMQELGIAGSGALSALSWSATGKLGKDVLKVGNEAAKYGVKKVAEDFAKNTFSKEYMINFLKRSLASKEAIGNYVGAGMMTASEISPYITGEKELTSEEFFKLVGKYGLNLAANVGEDFLRDSVSTYASRMSETELLFFNSQKSKNNKTYDIINDIENSLTPNQMSIVDSINYYSRNGQECVVTFNSTSEISSAMLEQIDDLSKVKIKVLDGLGDSNGALKRKYLSSSKYDTRVTYSGYEMKSIISKIENLQSKVDMNLPEAERAHQIYEILSAEVPVMDDFRNYTDGHLVSASLRGLTSNNSVGKEGLVCAGYASVYKELCERSGIKCDYVRGMAMIDPLTGECGGHAWNLVYTKDGMIPVDVTWHACSGGQKNWFGSSHEFVTSHIADADEINTNYSNMLGKNQLVFGSPEDKINSVLATMNQKYGNSNEGIERLRKYVKTGDINLITRTDDARSIVQRLSMSDVNRYLKKIDDYNSIKNAISTIDKKYGSYGTGVKVLKEYIKTGDSNLLTRTNNVRDTITSIDQKLIIDFINGR